MRFVWTLTGMLLLTVGTAALLGAAALGLLTGHAGPDGAFTARFETAQTPGHAVVVTDLDALVRREVPFARGGQARLRLDARTPDGPAFVGLARPRRCSGGWPARRTPRCSGCRWPGVRCRSGWNR